MGNYNNGRRDGNRGRSEMHKVVCDECGKNCQVPFKPTSSKPVLCSDCFGGNDGRNNRRNEKNGRDFSSRNHRGDRERRMHRVVCSGCGDKCEVPFKPSGDKPVLCDSCFGAEKTSKEDIEQERFDTINAKLDKIIKIVDILLDKKTLTLNKAEAKKVIEEENLKKEKDI